jgi:transcriptional regulator
MRMRKMKKKTQHQLIFFQSRATVDEIFCSLQTPLRKTIKEPEELNELVANTFHHENDQKIKQT